MDLTTVFVRGDVCITRHGLLKKPDANNVREHIVLVFCKLCDKPNSKNQENAEF